MNRIMIAGTGSGCGKTTVSCALMAAFKERGKKIAAFKCGPDYIDPMFHKKAADIESYNLDIFLMGGESAKYSLWSHGKSKDLCFIEGVMGLYDGGKDGVSSANHLSLLTDTPVVLVVDARGKYQSVCAEISGYLDYEKNNIRAVILNNVSEAMFPFYKSMVEEKLLVEVVGFMPILPEVKIDSRHLGLITADEIGDIKGKLEVLANIAEKSISLKRLSEIAESALPIKVNQDLFIVDSKTYKPKIYVAADEAFCFYYEDNQELLRAMGADLRFFSPLRDKELPKDAKGLILWGGYPELYSKALSENIGMKESIRRKIEDGMPVYGECGGFIYLQEQLTDLHGETYEMLGIIKGRAKMTGRLQNFGYAELTANSDNMLCQKGEKINAHSFHYFSSDYEGESFTATKISGAANYLCIEASNNIFAGYPHIHFFGNKNLAFRFIDTCAKYAKG